MLALYCKSCDAPRYLCVNLCIYENLCGFLTCPVFFSKKFSFSILEAGFSFYVLLQVARILKLDVPLFCKEIF